MGKSSVYNLRGLQCLVVGATLQSAGLITTTDSPESIQLCSEQSISLIAVLIIDEKGIQMISGFGLEAHATSR